MKTLFSIVLLFSFLIISHAKVPKLGAIPPELLRMTEHPTYPDAEAAYIYKGVKHTLVKDNSEVYGTHIVSILRYRIKIFKNSGVDWGTIKKRLYNDKKVIERILSIKGSVYSPNGGIAKITKDHKEIVKTSKNRYNHILNCPNVEAGSVIDVEITTTSNYPFELDEFYFQHSIPVDLAEFSLRNESYFAFNPISKGFLQYDEYDSSKVGLVKANKANVPPFKKEPYLDNSKNYQLSLKFALTTISFPGQPIRAYLEGWEDIGEKREEDLEKYLKPNKKFRLFLDQLVSPEESKKEKIKALITYFQQNNFWNGKVSPYVDNLDIDNLDAAENNSATVNAFLLAALNHHGIEAYPVILATLNHGMINPYNNPAYSAFNHMIIAIKKEKEGYDLIDATDKNGWLNILSTSNLNGRGYLLKDGTYEWIEIFGKKSMEAIKIDGKLELDGSFIAQVKINNSATDAIILRDEYDTEDDLEKYRKSNIEGMEVTNYTVENFDKNDKSITESFDITFQLAQEVDGKLIFNPYFFKKMEENPFSASEREYPISFLYPWSEKYIFSIEIPEGYQLVSPPAPTKTVADNFMKYTNVFKVQGDKLNGFKTTTCRLAQISSNKYEHMKEFFERIIQSESQLLVLEKKENIVND